MIDRQVFFTSGLEIGVIKLRYKFLYTSFVSCLYIESHIDKTRPLKLINIVGKMCFFFTKIKDIVGCPFLLPCLSCCNRLPTVQYLEIFYCIMRVISRKFKSILAHSVQIHICVLPIRKSLKKSV